MDSSRHLSSRYLNWRHYIPEVILCLRAGYSWKTFYGDLVAGLGLAALALPLNMAFAIACGLPPEVGLYTAVVAGFLAALLGGSAVAVGGPTGAFVVIIYTILQKHGYEGLAVATLMAGVFLILMGLARFGVMLKFISYPVITGFTSGIAVVIMSFQVKELLGLQVDGQTSAHVLDICKHNLQCLHTLSGYAVGTAGLSMLLILGLRRLTPKAPVYLITVTLTSLMVAWLQLPVETIGSKYGEVPSNLPQPHLPRFGVQMAVDLVPEAIAIAMLCALESLLCAMVADGLAGTRHRSDCELVGQGFANIGSVLFHGIPATGAIARTAANIRMGAKTPIASMVHAIAMLLIMLFFASYAKRIPLPSLAAIMLVVAWQMSEFGRIRELFRAPFADVVVLVISFALTVFVDLVVAVQVGIVLSTLLFIKHMSDRMTASAYQLVLDEGDENTQPSKDPEAIAKKDVPYDVAVFEINGPLFFGVVDILHEAIKRLEPRPYRYFILRMRHVPLVDATGMRALEELNARCKALGMVLLLAGVSDYVAAILRKGQVDQVMGQDHIFSSIDAALAYVKQTPAVPLQNEIQTMG